MQSNVPTHAGPVEATVHVGPFVGQLDVQWNPTIGRVTVSLGSQVSLQLRPAAADLLAGKLEDAVQAAARPAAPGAFPDHLLDADTDGGLS